MTDSVLVLPPLAPHPESLSDPRLTIRAEDERLLLHFCPRHHVGAVYDMEAQAWTLYCPMAAAEFISALPKLGVRVTDSGDLQVWIDSISTDPAQLSGPARGMN